jgi:hypothetical protein
VTNEFFSPAVLLQDRVGEGDDSAELVGFLHCFSQGKALEATQSPLKKRQNNFSLERKN